MALLYRIPHIRVSGELFVFVYIERFTYWELEIHERQRKLS
jgi:hypothetical protein